MVLVMHLKCILELWNWLTASHGRHPRHKLKVRLVALSPQSRRVDISIPQSGLGIQRTQTPHSIKSLTADSALGACHLLIFHLFNFIMLQQRRRQLPHLSACRSCRDSSSFLSLWVLHKGFNLNRGLFECKIGFFKQLIFSGMWL